MQIALEDNEIRVLAVLVEKALSQAGNYPLTLNSLTAGANQLQNRDPVVQLREIDVSEAIRTLQHKRLVVQAPPSAGARANRFEHKVLDVFKWDRREQAVMAELMLRGRQTAGELRTHASRMAPFQDVESVMVTLRGLMAAERRYVEELPREPGKAANRFRHLLGLDAGQSHSIAVGATHLTPHESEIAATMRGTSPAIHGDEMTDIKARLTRLEEQVGRLLAATQIASTDEPHP